MLYLKIFEEFDKDKFLALLNKHQKTTFLSTKDKKLLAQSDLNIFSFNSILNSIENSINFFEKFDFELFDEILFGESDISIKFILNCDLNVSSKICYFNLGNYILV